MEDFSDVLLSAGRQHSPYNLLYDFAGLCSMFLTTSHPVMIQKTVVIFMVEILATMALYDFILFVG